MGCSPLQVVETETGWNTRQSVWLPWLREQSVRDSRTELYMLLCPQILFLMVAKQLPAAREICFLFMSRERRVTMHRSSCSMRTTAQKEPGALSLGLVQNWINAGSRTLRFSPELRSLAKCHCPSPSGESGNSSQHALWVCNAESMRVNRISILDQSGPGVAQRQCFELGVTVKSGPRMVPKGHRHLMNRERGACESEFLTPVYLAFALM